MRKKTGDPKEVENSWKKQMQTVDAAGPIGLLIQNLYARHVIFLMKILDIPEHTFFVCPMLSCHKGASPLSDRQPVAVVTLSHIDLVIGQLGRLALSSANASISSIAS